MTTALCLLATILLSTSAQEPLQLGDRLELFVDDYLISELRGVRLQPGRLRDEGAVLRFDRPWEGPFAGYSTVIHDDERYLLFYRGLPRAGADGTALECTCVALSSDGLTWERPKLSLYEMDGHDTNNVVLAQAAPVTHNFSPFLDTRPGVPAEQRFKGLGGTGKSGLIAHTSPDGLRWSRLQDEPVFTEGVFDSQNVSFWSEHEGCYLCYFRTWSGGDYSGFRTVSRTTSEDFLSWTTPESMTFGDTPPEHLYTNQTHPYFRAPHLYVGVAARFMPGRQVLSESDALRLGVDPGYFRDCSDAVLLTSRGGTRYDRAFMEAFLRPGIGLENWVSRSNYPALNIVRTGPTEMSLYVNQNYAQPTAELRRYSMRLDGLGSVHADRAGGELVTHPVVFTGVALTLNLATSAAGEVRVELQDAGGTPLPGFGLGECIPLIGNDLERVVTWRRPDGSTADLSSVAGTAVRLRFALVDADLYSLRFATSESGDGSP
jgi:hypothetical protein